LGDACGVGFWKGLVEALLIGMGLVGAGLVGAELGEVFSYPGPVAIEVFDLSEQMGPGVGFFQQGVRAGFEALDAKAGAGGWKKEDYGDMSEMPGGFQLAAQVGGFAGKRSRIYDNCVDLSYRKRLIYTWNAGNEEGRK